MKTITVTFVDRLSGREVYACGVQSRGTSSAHRCKALDAAYTMAAARGVNVCDHNVFHRFN